MTKEQQPMSGHFAFEMRRQMTSGQMRRFVRSLPAFQVEPDLPDPFADLLNKLDSAQAPEGGRSGSKGTRSS
jgi:hypothetical protein